MPKVKSDFLDFIRHVVNGDIAEVSRRLTASPALATTASDAGATRQEAATYFFREIAHYFYAGDTALHMAAAGFRRPVAELLVAYGADCTRGIGAEGQPLRTMRRTPTTGTRRPRPETITRTSCRSVPIPMSWINRAWRPYTERCAPGRRRRYERSWTVGQNRRDQIRLDRRPCTSPSRPPGAAGAVLSMHASNRRTSSGCCWSAVPARPTKTDAVNRCFRRRRVRRSEPCSAKRPG